MQTRAQKRQEAQSLATQYGAPFKLALAAVNQGVQHRAVALATGEANEKRAFVAALNVLAK